MIDPTILAEIDRQVERRVVALALHQEREERYLRFSSQRAELRPAAAHVSREGSRARIKGPFVSVTVDGQPVVMNHTGVA